jgi:hypothetical protein
MPDLRHLKRLGTMAHNTTAAEAKSISVRAKTEHRS